MSNLKIYNDAFIEVFEVEEDQLGPDFTNNTVANWDSMRKLNLLNILEDEFEVVLSPTDMLAFNSYEEGKSILGNYGIEL